MTILEGLQDASMRTRITTSGGLLVIEKKNMYSSFSSNKETLVLLLYLISILSCKVTHTGSIHKYTQLTMLTNYFPSVF